MPPRSHLPEADKWRTEAEEALKKFSKAMDFFLFATAQLVRVTSVHTPDEFSHCSCCKLPWPCETMQIVRRIGDEWTRLQAQGG